MDADGLDRLQKTDLNAKASEIFDSAEGTVGQQVKEGLGWTARARQTSSHAERYLHLFTAMEALLSDLNKDWPVVQTIARNAATILNAPERRARIAGRVSGMYRKRSQLVHRGSREAIAPEDVRQLQAHVEMLYRIVLRKQKLSDQIGAFTSALRECGYGLLWPAPERRREAPSHACWQVYQPVPELVHEEADCSGRQG